MILATDIMITQNDLITITIVGTFFLALIATGVKAFTWTRKKLNQIEGITTKELTNGHKIKGDPSLKDITADTNEKAAVAATTGERTELAIIAIDEKLAAHLMKSERFWIAMNKRLTRLENDEASRNVGT